MAFLHWQGLWQPGIQSCLGRTNPSTGGRDPLGQKLQHISDIKRAGGTVLHKIIRFGLFEDEALKIEASLIDLVNHIKPDTLKNEILGQGVAEGFYDAGTPMASRLLACNGR